MTDRELLQQALDVMLAAIKSGDWKVDGACDPDWVIEAIKARLAHPKKEWVGLKDDDVNLFVDAIYKGFDMKPRNEIEIQYFERLIKFIDRKLKEKNS